MPRNVLIIEDDRDIAHLVELPLKDLGCHCTLAQDGELGLQLALKNRYDLIILDVMLPDIDGLEVCRRIRDVDARLPVLLLTAKDAASDQILGLDAGADDYLVKPFGVDVLRARLRALLRREMPAGEVLRYADLELETSVAHGLVVRSRSVALGQ